MRSWIPVPGTAKERLVSAALELFGARGYAPVGVGELATAAGVTTGSLYHHFGGKLELYAIVRADVERRAIDRMRGAAAVSPVRDVAGCAPVLLVGFDYLVAAGFARLLGEEHPTDLDDDAPPDPIAMLLAELVDTKRAPVSVPLAAAWRASLRASADDPRAARAGFARLLALTKRS